MSTTWNVAPHGPDGKVDLSRAEATVAHGIAQVRNGSEKLLGMSRVDLEDGTHLTIIHHKAK